METYNGHVRTPADAIILFEACRIGLLPRVQRRLSEKERQSIKSGSVFVWDEREAGMRRWTDGKSWSASRVSGSFLTYREMEGKRGGAGSFDKNASRDTAQATNDQDSDGGPDGYRYKPDGLMKQSFSITTNNSQHLHLISYYSRSSQQSQHLMQPTNDPQLRHIRPEKGMYPESTVQEQSTIPAVTRGPMGSPGYTHAAHHQPPPMYGRPGYGYPPHPGAWAPPSPMHTPPPHPHYGPYYQHPAHPGYGHPMGYPPHPAYGAVSYDNRPPHMGGHLPHPPHYSHGPPPPSAMQAPGYPPGYAPYQGYSYAPPPVSAASYHASVAPTPAASAPPAPKVDARPIPPPVTIPEPNLPEPKKDERQDSQQSTGQLKSPARSTPEAQAQSGAQSQASAPPSTTPATAPTTSSGQTIPSIHTMLTAGENGQPPVRSSSRSPGGSRMASDIPMHKLGFEASRDVQALRNLDKTTFKAY
jgi:hypothetical protein